MFTLQRFKTTAVFVGLAVLLLGAVWAYARTVVDGDNVSVSWWVLVEDLEQSGDYTYSTHEYSITNHRTTPIILIEQEFKHRVMQTYPGESGKLDVERIARANDDVTHTVRIGPGRTKSRYYKHRVDISSLTPGTYYIDTYTRINIDKIIEDPTPEAKENTKADTFEIEDD